MNDSATHITPKLSQAASSTRPTTQDGTPGAAVALLGRAPTSLRHVGTAYYGDTKTNAIGWCSRTFNLFRGCTRCGPECASCYAAEEALHQQRMRPSGAYKRLAVLGQDGKPNWTGVVEPADRRTWVKPFETRQRWLVFANSMSDVFHDEISDELVLHFFRTIFKSPWHQWQVLTKRHTRMRSFMRRLYIENGELMLAERELPEEQQALIPNLWMGVTAGTQKSVDARVPMLLQVKAGVRWISIEPLLESVTLKPYLDQLDWIVVGGESAGRDKSFRPMDEAWAKAIRDECVEQGTPYWFKQRAGLRPWRMPKDLDGKIWHQLPRRELSPIPSAKERRVLIEWARSAIVPGLL